MPKEGFKSITVSDYTYERFQEAFEGSRKTMAAKGVTSLSGYVTYKLEEALDRDNTFARYAPKIENLSVEDDRVILKDNIKNRIVEVVIQQGEINCLFCNSRDCVHIGYVFSLPDIYKALSAKGIGRPSRS